MDHSVADGRDYPDQWVTYTNLVKGGRLNASAEWSRFAARYRAASAFHSLDFMGTLSAASKRGYTAAVRLLMCFSAFEAACLASGKKPFDISLSSDGGIYREARTKLIKAFADVSEAQFPLRGALTNEKLADRVDAFFRGEDPNLEPVARSLRHLFAHGAWTPYGSDTITKTACDAVDLLSQILLHAADDLLNAHLASV